MSSRPAVIHRRGSYTPPAPGTLQPTAARRFVLTVGAAHSHEALFTTTTTGSLREAQDCGAQLGAMYGRTVWCRDALTEECWHRPVGGTWVAGEGGDA